MAVDLAVETKEQRIAKAIAFAVQYSGFEGEQHGKWVIDQMVRALTGCPILDLPSGSHSQGTSAEYLATIEAAQDGENGPETYSWDVGVSP